MAPNQSTERRKLATTVFKTGQVLKTHLPSSVHYKESNRHEQGPVLADILCLAILFRAVLAAMTRK